MSKPKVIIYDIETSPCVVYSWRTGFKLNIGHENIVEERKVICICWKEAGSKKVHHLTWDKRHNDKSMLKKFSKVLNECDVAIGHNGDKFDLKWLKGRVLFHRLPPLTNVTTVDTLKLSRANFNLNSHRLDYIGQFLGVGQKVSTGGFQLWVDCMAGKKTALAKMVKYCKQDVNLLEQVYETLLPYVDRLPIHNGVLQGGDREDCPSCGHDHSQKYGFRSTRAGRYQKFKCTSCAHVFASPKMLKA